MRRIALFGLVIIRIAATAHADVTPNACGAAKKQCVARRADATLKCHVLAEKRGNSIADESVQACLQKASDRFDGGAAASAGCFAKAEAKYAGGCLTSDDTPDLASLVDTYVGDVVTALDPGYPTPIQNACSAAKKKCVERLATGLLKCHVKNGRAAGWDPTPFSQCIVKALRRYDPQEAPNPGCFAELEAKYQGACLTVSDTDALRGRAVEFVGDALCELDPGMCPTPTPTATPLPSFACCQLSSSCADIPGVPAAECAMFGGIIHPGEMCMSGGACGVPPTPTLTPTPTPTPTL